MDTVNVTCECIVRRNDVFAVATHAPLLVFIGHSAGLADCVKRCNEGKATEADLIILSAFPVFDADVSNVPEFIVEER